jgi:hypothetical protein
LNTRTLRRRILRATGAAAIAVTALAAAGAEPARADVCVSFGFGDYYCDFYPPDFYPTDIEPYFGPIDPFDPIFNPYCCFEPYIPPPTIVDPPIVPNDTYFPAGVPEQQASGAFRVAVRPGSPDFERLLLHTNPNIVFARDEANDANPANDEEDRLMTPQAAARLDQLAILVMNEWPGTKLVVTDAYDSDGGHGEPTLHAEGRAVDLQTFPKDNAKLARLARLAVDAGFTWVSNEHRANHVHASVPQPPSPPREVDMPDYFPQPPRPFRPGYQIP